MNDMIWPYGISPNLCSDILRKSKNTSADRVCMDPPMSYMNRTNVMTCLRIGKLRKTVFLYVVTNTSLDEVKHAEVKKHRAWNKWRKNYGNPSKWCVYETKNKGDIVVNAAVIVDILRTYPLDTWLKKTLMFIHETRMVLCSGIGKW